MKLKITSLILLLVFRFPIGFTENIPNGLLSNLNIPLSTPDNIIGFYPLRSECVLWLKELI